MATLESPPAAEPVSPAAALGPEQVRRYRDDGVLVLPGVFGADELAGFERGWAALKAKVASGDAATRQDRFIFGLLPPPLDRIYQHPRLVAVARQLLGDDVALYMNRVLLKDPTNKAAVSLHQDMVYFHGGQAKLSVFVPLAPATAATGGLRFVLGSHHHGNLGVRGVIQPDRFPPMPVLAPELHPGDACLMDFLIWHDSVPATVEAERPLVQIAYQPATDGSYYDNGVPEPTLVCGRWRTACFTPLGRGVKPDAPAGR